MSENTTISAPEAEMGAGNQPVKKKAVSRKEMSKLAWTLKEMKKNYVAYLMVAPFYIIFLRHFRFQKCLPVYSNSESARFYIYSSFFSSPCPAWRLCSKCTSSTEISAGDTPAIRDA